MKILRFAACCAFATLAATSANADDVVTVPATVPYLNDNVANESVRKECTWNTSMPRYLEQKSDGRVKVGEAGPGKKLLLVATHLHAIGGGGWTGPKWLTLEGKLMQGDRVIGNFEARRQTIRGSLRACGTLDSLSEEISDDILEWLKVPGMNAKLGDAG